MIEKFKNSVLTGDINVTCKYDDGSVRVWSAKKEDVIKHIIEVVDEYAEDGYVLTLRQLHYQLVTKNYIINHDTAYKKLGNILDDCRYGGLINWEAIEDRGRIPHLLYYADGVNAALQDTVDSYRRNRQEYILALSPIKEYLRGHQRFQVGVDHQRNPVYNPVKQEYLTKKATN